MNENNYDQASRYLAKESGAPVQRWLVGMPQDELGFRRFLDKALVLPGYPERIPDLIAELTDQTRGGVFCAAITEFQIAPDPNMFGRMLIAGGLIYNTLKPDSNPGDRYVLIAVIVNLTGKGDCAKDMTVGTARWVLKPREINVEELDADVVMDEVVAGKTPREVLALIPLMQKGGEDATITRWLGIVSAEPSLKKRGDYALAVMYAQAVGLRALWEKRLEGLLMADTPLVAEWKRESRDKGRIEGKIEGKVDSLFRILRRKGAPVPEDLAGKLRACQDGDEIDRWTDLALDVTTVDDFRKQANL